MRDPFDSGPVLRLGDAPAKKLIAESRAARPETGIVPNCEVVAVEATKTDTAAPRPPSLAPEFGDAFGAAFSKSRRSIEFDVSFPGLGTLRGVEDIVVSGAGTLDGVYESAEITVDRARSEVTITGIVRKGDKGSVTLRGLRPAREMNDLARKSADGAMRYEPAPRLHPLFPACRPVEPEILSEEEFARRYPGPAPMIVFDEAVSFSKEAFDFLARKDRPRIAFRRGGETDAEFRERIRANHAALVAKKDPAK